MAPCMTPTRRSILAVTSELPWPLNTGGHLRTFHVLRALSRHYRVRLVVPATSDPRTQVDALRDHGLDVIPVPVGARVRHREAWRAASAAIARQPYVFYRRHHWEAVQAELERQSALESPDVFYLDHLDSLVYRPLLPGTPAVIDLHNVYSTLADRAASEQRFWPLRAYLRREAKLLHQRERRAMRQSAAVLATSDEDIRLFTSLGGRTVLVPNGVDCSAYADLPTGRPAGVANILYVGAMSWSPNAAAVVYLARHVMPKVTAVIPHARLGIVGRGATEDVKALAQIPGVDVLGEVAAVQPHLNESALLAVPLEAGGGTRLKILEAFAAGLPVVSTAVGCEGLRVTHGEHLTIAERPAFADAIIAALSDAASGVRLATNARIRVRELYDWNTVGAAACDAVARLC